MTNALGQLTRVDEPNSSNLLRTVAAPNQPTNYVYDTLNNLTTVSQGVQTRTFVYDSLSRLKQANNPESGIINYLYDNNSNLTSKTDARLVVTNYVYDALNRVTQRNYTAPGGLANYQATPNVTYFYDNLPNAKGKLTKVTNGTGVDRSTTEYTAFDILGRVARSKQTTDGIVYGTDAAPMTYTYNLSGAMIEQKYPSGRVVKNTLDADGDLAQVQSKKNAADILRNYANSFVYMAAGAVSSMRLGNGKFENTQFNSRLQPTQIGLGASASSQNLLKLNYDYGTMQNNGNVLSQTITVPTVGTNTGFAATQTYTYDSLNRIKDATENIAGQTPPSWKQTFLYDRYGNRNFDTTLNRTTTIPAGCSTAVCNPGVNVSDNRLKTSDGYVFDNAGNTTKDANLRKFTYDGENKQVKVETTNSGGTVIATNGEYVYDGDGKRIKKKGYTNNVLTEETIFVYDAASKLVAEYSTVVAPASTAQIAYLTIDHLGSPRVTTNATGQAISRRDFMPFGEEIARANYGSDSVRQKFTGYERDAETNLDFAQARYFNSGIGRFSSPDSFTNDTHASDSQSWNLYVYVRNNPLNYVDTLGKKAEVTSTYDKETNTVTIRIKASFAVYGAKGQNVSSEDLAKYTKRMVSGIMNAYNGSFAKDGRTYKLETSIDAKVVGSEDEAKASGADNLVEMGNRDIDDSSSDGLGAAVFSRPGENFDRMMVSIGGEVPGGISDDYETTFAHEFAHLLGMPDRDRRPSLFNTSYPDAAMSQLDYEDLFSQESFIAHPASPPSGIGIKRGDIRHRSAGTDLTALRGSSILGSTTSAFELRRTNGQDLYRWVNRVKK